MSIYQHFHQDEKGFIDQVLQWQQFVLDRYTLKRSDFLDPREQDIVESVIGKDSDLNVTFWGGSNTSERKRMLLYPQYFEIDRSDFNLAVFQVNYPDKFVSIEHRDLLGSLMNLGVKRSKFGDILVGGNTIQFVVSNDIAEYIRLNLDNVGKAAVTIEQISENEILLSEEEWFDKSGTVSSLRLDAVLAELFHLSRSKAAPYIQNRKVKVNWKIVEQPSFELKQGDYLSVRGLGRGKLLSVEGKTKKDKWKITMGLRK
jgi:RNA-binding protein YlmH